jgi:hypothetical protein
MFDPRLYEFATERQAEYFKAYEKHGSLRKAAAELNINKRNIERAILRVKQKAVRQGWSPEHHMTQTVPEGFYVRGVSTYYDEEGKPKGQWVKSAVDQSAQEALFRQAFDAMAQDLKPLDPVKAPVAVQEHLATLYTLTDSHVGMLAWGAETGADWDLTIAEKVLTGCFQQMVSASPWSQVGIVSQLGDFLHQDSIEAVTPASKHLLDSDGRFSKVVATAIRILRRVVDMALIKHSKVIVLMAEGNHDTSSSIWLRVMFKALYEKEPRIEVIDSPLPYYAYQHGKTMLGFHHGHLRKNDQLPLLFAAQFPTVWGSTKKRYVHTGHRHHVEEKEHNGVTVIQHPTLAARDAYAARGGWLSERQVRAISYHAEHGEVARTTIVPEMLG